MNFGRPAFRDYALLTGGPQGAPLALAEDSGGIGNTNTNPLGDLMTSGALVAGRMVLDDVAYGVSFAPRTFATEVFVRIEDGPEQRLLLGDVLWYPAGFRSLSVALPRWVRQQVGGTGLLFPTTTLPVGLRCFFDPQSMPVAPQRYYSGEGLFAPKDNSIDIYHYVALALPAHAEWMMRLRAYNQDLQSSAMLYPYNWDGVELSSGTVSLAQGLHGINTNRYLLVSANNLNPALDRVVQVAVGHNTGVVSGGRLGVLWGVTLEARTLRT